MKKTVIVVEGHHDEQKIKSVYPDVECIVTNGSSITKETLNLIYQTSLTNEVILFLDPDFPGKKITNQILETRGNYKIVFISKEEALSKNHKKIGVEHATKMSIKNALNLKKEILFQKDPEITAADLHKRKLTNHPNSKHRRSALCKSLNIPLFNGKALAKYLNMLGISLERIDAIINEKIRL